MSFSDYLLDGVLIGLVLVQIRGRRLTTHAQLLPLAIIGYVVVHYLHSFPTAGNDLLLELGLLAVGLVLGLGAGFTTRLSVLDDGSLLVRAGVAAATLWVLGMGCRLAFSVYATHGGGTAIARFMTAHDLTTQTVWVTGLVLMAAGEVLARSGAIAWRAAAVRRAASPAGVAVPLR